MSAYVVSPDTVRLLVAVTDRYGLHATMRDIYPDRTATDVVGEDRTDDEMRGLVMRYVLSVNARAVAYRYPNDNLNTMPGYGYEYRTDTQWHPLPVVDYVPVPFLVWDDHGASIRASVAARVLGAAQCLAYQCCELPEWESTPAYRWLTRVVWRASSVLAEGWEISDISEAA